MESTPSIPAELARLSVFAALYSPSSASAAKVRGNRVIGAFDVCGELPRQAVLPPKIISNPSGPVVPSNPTIASCEAC